MVLPMIRPLNHNEIKQPEEMDSDGGHNSTRQRLHSCMQDIKQLESLRLKHKMLMEQLRRDYPSMRSFVKSMDSDDHDDVGDYFHQHSDSGDSGIGQNSLTYAASDNPMTYSNFRKMSLEERREAHRNNNNAPNTGHIVENTLKNLTSRLNSNVIPTKTWLRSKGPLDNSNRPKSCYGGLEKETKSARPSSLIVTSKRSSKILDSNTFAQLTPPPATRKFATVEPPLRFEGPLSVQTKSNPSKNECFISAKPQTDFKLQKAELISSITNSFHSGPNYQSARTQMSKRMSTISTNGTLNYEASLEPLREKIEGRIPTVRPFSWRKSDVEQDPKKLNRSSMLQCSELPKTNNIAYGNNEIPGNCNVTKLNNTGMVKNLSAVFGQNRNIHRAVASVPPIIQSNTNSKQSFHASFAQTSPNPFKSTASLSINKPINDFSSSCSIAISVPSRNPDKPLIKYRRPRQWHESENL